MKQLAGRTAILTGASRGIGVYIARALSEQGMNLVLAARSGGDLEDVRASLAARGNGGVISVPTDVRKDDDQQRLVDSAEAEFGQVDLLVNNAGIEMVLNYEKLTRDEIDSVLDVNLRAPMHLARLLLPAMVSRGYGHIVNISSLAGRAGPACLEPYAGTKAGLVGFTQSLRASFRHRGVSASVICPGFVDAGMYEVGRTQRSERSRPRTGIARPEAVAEAVVRAVVKDQGDVIVSARPVRPLLTVATAAPGLAERLSRFFDSNALFREAAAQRENELGR
jgi:short-subunit dehydrogenase